MNHKMVLKKAFLRTFIKRIEIKGDKAVIRYTLPVPLSGAGHWHLGGLLCRKRYIDDKIIESAKQIDAVVNLGVGVDTRAYRLTVLSDLHDLSQ